MLPLSWLCCTRIYNVVRCSVFVSMELASVASDCCEHKQGCSEHVAQESRRRLTSQPHLQPCPRALSYFPHALHTPLHPSHACNHCTLIFHGRSTQTPRPTMHTSIGGSERWKSSSLVGGRRKPRAVKRERTRTHKMPSPSTRATSSCLACVERSWTDSGTTGSGSHSD